MTNRNEAFQQILSGIVDGNRREVPNLVQDAIDSGENPVDLLYQAMIPAMEEVGRLFENGEYYIPEMLLSAATMQDSMKIISPFLKDSNVKPVGTVVAGTVSGDLHDIGKNLVCIMLSGAGFEIHDLGADVDTEEFIRAVRDHMAQIVAISALLTTTMVKLADVVLAFKEAGLYGDVKIMIGGAPVTQNFAEQIGAHGYAPDASRAINVAKSLLSK